MRNGKKVEPMEGYSCQIVVGDAINWLETEANTDRAIDRLVTKLKETGKLNITLIIYCSDNVCYRADRNGGLTGNNRAKFQGGLRSPGIFLWTDGRSRRPD